MKTTLKVGASSKTIRALKAKLAAAQARIDELQAWADTDFLLNIYNRRGFERELARSIAYIKRYAATGALVVLDVDRLKPVNDKFGHAAGDVVLKGVVAVLMRHVRSSDVVGRLGGDEFGLLLWNLTEADARTKAKALEDEARHNDLFDKKLEQEEAWIRQGVKARRTRNEGRVRALYALREESEARIKPVAAPRIHVEEADPSSRKVVELRNVVHGFGGKPVIKGVSVKIMRGERIGLVGNNGVGKSTLINLLLPDAKVATNEISQALNTGKHTTTSTTLYWVDEARTTAIIDSPGFQEFGLYHIAATQLAACMPDIGALADQCKFYNCTHLHEPGCAVMAQVDAQDSPHSISANRYRIYGELFDELSQEPRY